jgi:hypothetical protein
VIADSKVYMLNSQMAILNLQLESFFDWVDSLWWVAIWKSCIKRVYRLNVSPWFLKECDFVIQKCICDCWFKSIHVEFSDDNIKPSIGKLTSWFFMTGYNLEIFYKTRLPIECFTMIPFIRKVQLSWFFMTGCDLEILYKTSLPIECFTMIPKKMWLTSEFRTINVEISKNIKFILES